MHADREWAALRLMRTVQAAAATSNCAWLDWRSSDAQTLRAFNFGALAHRNRTRTNVAVANGCLRIVKPMQIPTPFNNSSFSRGTIAINRNGRSFRSGNFFTAVAISSEVDIPANFLMTYSTAAHTVVRFALNAVPVDQCQAHTGIIRRNPSTAGRLAWKKYAMVFKLDDLRWQSGKAVPFFIAIHREVESPWTRKKRNRAHLIRQRVR